MKNALLAAALVAALASAGAAAAHADPAVVGLLAALAFAGITIWAGLAALALRAPDDCTEPRYRLAIPQPADEASVTRGGVFGRLWIFAISAFGLATIVPIVSLGRRAGHVVGTAWAAGARVVTEDGRPLRPDDIAIGGVTTVFPEGHVGAQNAAALLIRVEDDAMRTNHAWAPQGNVAFSKICTHAGCPVAIYVHLDHMLYCPCHQSQFSVLFGARPVAGPATRALPQLELEIGADGYLVARGDFSGPVGPDDWNRPA
jgi:ubiquinol-cytochrome c reductase iron-sulfur subunit